MKIKIIILIISLFVFKIGFTQRQMVAHSLDYGQLDYNTNKYNWENYKCNLLIKVEGQSLTIYGKEEEVYYTGKLINKSSLGLLYEARTLIGNIPCKLFLGPISGVQGGMLLMIEFDDTAWKYYCLSK